MATEQEEIEKAALEYANQIVLEAQDFPEYFAFINGVEWQKEQSAIPTYEEISNIASDYAIEKCKIMQQMKCLAARKTAYIDGYKQALKDLGYEYK